MKNRPISTALSIISFFWINILCSQNVGINTSDPKGNLHINSNVGDTALVLESSNNFGVNGLQFRLSESEEFFEINRIIGAGESSSYLDFIYKSTPRLTIKGNGNVGIGDLNPDNKLDVNGDINLNGDIKVNNIEGTPGQVLAAMPDGSTGWADTNSDRFKYFYSYVSNNSWTVPTGVNEVCIEAWGGGGGSSAGGGGGSGGYVKAIFSVVAGQTITFTIGLGGGANNGGGTTFVNYGSNVFRAYGGFSNVNSGGDGGFIGNGNGGPELQSVFGMKGEDGQPTRIEYQQKNATTFVKTFYYGDGGNAPFRSGSSGKGGCRIVGESGTGIFDNIPSTRGKFGGGAGASVSGKSASNGMVIIRW